MNQQIVENVLRNTYNLLWGRRNPAYSKFYDVYLKHSNAREHFKVLARRLIKLDIEPRLYITVMSNYGIWYRTKFLPPTGWLKKKKAIHIYSEWFLEHELKKYDGQKGVATLGLQQGVEVKEEEVLNTLQSDVESLSGLALTKEAYLAKREHWDFIKVHLLFEFYQGGMISQWYVSTRPDFVQSEYMKKLGKVDRSRVKEAVSYYKAHKGIIKMRKEILGR